MFHAPIPAAVPAASLPLALDIPPAAAVLAAAGHLLPHLERAGLSMPRPCAPPWKHAFGASDATGAWDWKTAYDACEAATVLFLRKYGKALFRKAASPASRLAALTKIAGLLPTHTRRSEETQTFQQFSTPIPLGLAALTAASLITPPTGCWSLRPARACSPSSPRSPAPRSSSTSLPRPAPICSPALFPAISVTRFDAAQIDDHLDRARHAQRGADEPAVLGDGQLSRPRGRRRLSAHRLGAGAACARRAAGRDHRGELLARACRPGATRFIRLQERGRVVFTAAIAGSVYAKHGTTIETRLTVIDKAPGRRSRPSSRIPPASRPMSATLLAWIERACSRRGCRSTLPQGRGRRPHAHRTVRGYLARVRGARATPAASPSPTASTLDYETIDWTPRRGRPPVATRSTSPTRFSRSAFPAPRPIPPSWCSRRPWPRSRRRSRATGRRLPAAIVTDGVLSDAQLETVIYAGEAHGEYLAGAWTVDETCDLVTAAPDDAAGAVRFRRGFMLGDGTGAGKGRQSAGIILDNWLQGRRKAVWISKSDKLLEDAQRDWSALGMERLLVTPLSRFPQGTAIRLGGRHPFHDLCHAAVRRPRREGFAGQADRRMVGLRFRRSDHFRRGPRHAERRRRQGRTGRCRPLAAGPCGAAAAARAAERPRRLCLGDRRHHRPQSRLCPAARPVGRRGFPLRRPAPSSSRRSRPAASRPWRCWRATCARSASTRPARCPTTASNTSWSSTSSRPSRPASTTPMPAPSPSSTITSTRRCRPPTSPATAAR